MGEAAAVVDQGVDLEVLLLLQTPSILTDLIIPLQVVPEALEVADDITSHNQTLNDYYTTSIICWYYSFSYTTSLSFK